MKLDPNFQNHEGRGGGRTTRLFVQAVEYLRTFQDVVFLSPTLDVARYNRDAFLDLAADDLDPKVQPNGFRVEARLYGSFITFASATQRPEGHFLGRVPAPNLLVDHFTYEAAAERDLKLWLILAERRVAAEVGMR